MHDISRYPKQNAMESSEMKGILEEDVWRYKRLVNVLSKEVRSITIGKDEKKLLIFANERTHIYIAYEGKETLSNPTWVPKVCMHSVVSFQPTGKYTSQL